MTDTKDQANRFPDRLASLPVLFLVAWVAGAFGYGLPAAGQTITISTSPSDAAVHWQPAATARQAGSNWEFIWPGPESPTSIRFEGSVLVQFPLDYAVPIVHKKQWWNVLFANPLGYLPDNLPLDKVDIALEPQRFMPLGPDWVRGWMFLFFSVFLFSSLAFKFVLKID